VTFRWPNVDVSILFWAESVLIWIASQYVSPNSSRTWTMSIVRSLVAGLLIFLTAWTGRVWWFAILTGLFTAGFSACRIGKTAWPSRIRIDLGFIGSYILVAAICIGTANLTTNWIPPVELVDPRRLAALILIAAGIVFLLRGGAEIVRAVLERSNSMPRGTDDVPGDDDRELERGRLIGYLERLLITAFIIAGQYAALGFLVAAKGLVRSKELEKHSFAEYFLVGTLTSLTIACFVGLALKAVVSALW
jgi:hypothetical protein